MKSYAYSDIDEKQIHITMRMIGHEILLNGHDSVSLVLAIEKDMDRYKIEFSSEFQFYPEDLVPIINKNIHKAGISNAYIVEVENCETKEIIYSYKIENSPKSDVIPCRGRMQPKACYKIFITILDSCDLNESFITNTSIPDEPKTAIADAPESGSSYFSSISLMGIPLLLFASLFYLFLRRKPIPKTNPDLIHIGNYQFDKKKMELSYEDNSTELTSKEADLLCLLHTSANNTLERELILKTVWGDEGDYIGRTLDVFISKLRKKLEADSSVKIVNIRGIGYKLVLNN